MEYMTPADRPVIAGLEEFETIFARNQGEYNALRALCSNDRRRKVLSRWTFTPEQRTAIACGADVFLEQVTFGDRLQPVRLGVSHEPGASWWHDAYHLKGRETAFDEDAKTSADMTVCETLRHDDAKTAPKIVFNPSLEKMSEKLAKEVR